MKDTHKASIVERISNERAEYKELGTDVWQNWAKLDSNLINDETDDVQRCGECGWEIVGSGCSNCGTQFANLEEETDEYSDINSALESENEESSADDGFVVSDDPLTNGGWSGRRALVIDSTDDDSINESSLQWASDDDGVLANQSNQVISSESSSHSDGQEYTLSPYCHKY